MISSSSTQSLPCTPSPTANKTWKRERQLINIETYFSGFDQSVPDKLKKFFEDLSGEPPKDDTFPLTRENCQRHLSKDFKMYWEFAFSVMTNDQQKTDTTASIKFEEFLVCVYVAWVSKHRLGVGEKLKNAFNIVALGNNTITKEQATAIVSAILLNGAYLREGVQFKSAEGGELSETSVSEAAAVAAEVQSPTEDAQKGPERELSETSAKEARDRIRAAKERARELADRLFRKSELRWHEFMTPCEVVQEIRQGLGGREEDLKNDPTVWKWDCCLCF